MALQGRRGQRRGSRCDSVSVACSVTDLMVVDGVQHGYACRLRRLSPVTGEWTADAPRYAQDAQNKLMMDTCHS